MARSLPVPAAFVLAVMTAVMPGVAEGGQRNETMVSADPANNTPVLVDPDPDTGPALHVDAIDKADGTVYAGGLFNRVADAKGNGGSVFARSNLYALDSSTFEVRESFHPVVDGNVWAIEATAHAVFIGGSFRTVNGLHRPALAKLDPVTGALDADFDAQFDGGRIEDLDRVDGRLIVAGKNARKLMALDPQTGRDTGYIDLEIADQVPGSRGGVTIFDFAVHPDGTQLLASGNFLTVAGQPRAKFFVADLRPEKATLNDWYYKPFAEPCSTTNPRRVANLQGVDYSPGGSRFAIAATGQVVNRARDRNVTVCDAVGYFDLTDDSAPRWINYTGGDSVWSTSVTGAAVYAQGHFSWLNNTQGDSSHCPDAARDVCVPRKGVGAIDRATGLARRWDPNKPARLGGKDFLSTRAGLWIGSDSRRIHGERRYGLAFMPVR